MLIFAMVLLMRSEMIEPVKPTTMEKTKRVPMLRLLPVMVPKLTPKTICTTVSTIESIRKTARLAKKRKPKRFNMVVVLFDSKMPALSFF